MCLTGNLERPGDKGHSIYRPNIAVCSFAQVATFCAAIILTVIFGFKAL